MTRLDEIETCMDCRTGDVRDVAGEIDAILDGKRERRALDLMVEVPCPMKSRFREKYLAFEQGLTDATGRRPFSFVPTICPSHVEIDDTIRDYQAMVLPENVPDIILGLSFGDKLFTDFFPRHVEGGLFKRVIDNSQRQLVADDRFRDRYEAFNPIAVFPEVMLVDRRVLGERPVPKRLEDLLDPVYEGVLGLPDEHTEIGIRFLLHVYKNYGEEGLAAVERNAMCGFVGPEGARTAGTKAEPAAAVYLTPWIFAQGAENPGRVDVVWPEDGVLVQPISLLVKRDMRPENEPILEWLLSDQVARIFSENYFPSTKPGIDNRIPNPDQKLSWLGWDWIYDTDIKALKESLVERFNRFHREAAC